MIALKWNFFWDGNQMTDVFSAAELVTLTAEVDRQLANLTVLPMAPGKDPMDEVRSLRSQLAAQRGAIAQAAGEPADGFLRKFARVARRDVCEEGGLLNQQWEQYQDLSRADTLAVVGGALGLLGLANPVVTAIAVPVTVVILHLGLRTFCEEYGEKTEG
jgi:hypothetical protein